MSQSLGSIMCDSCHAKFPLGAETQVVMFTKQPWMNHVITQCPNCSTGYIIWDLPDQVVEYLRENPDKRVTWSIQDFAPDAVERRYSSDKGIPMLREVWVSPRKAQYIENQAMFFRFLLEKGLQLEY